ncbi:MAG TPA: hypothetical protein VLD86_14710, partial [Ilumatobacteraceae bacterium]|nr:hypothetical protein [Ilumatobacteraceae bacterium]
MDVLRVLVRAGTRQRRGGLAATALLLSLGIGAGLAVLSTAWKTDHAYPDYLRRAAVNELIVNPRFVTDRLIDLIRSTPGVESMVTDALLNASISDNRPQTRGESTSVTTAVVGSLDGRYTKRDRPVITRGRMPEAVDEAFLSVSTAKAISVGVGSVVPVTFWPTAPSDAPTDVVVQPLGTHRLRVVGIGVFSDEVLPDDLFPHQRVVVSPELARRYICTPVQPATDDPRSIDELLGVFFPPNCSSDARFFSLQVSGGDAGVDEVMAALNERFAAESQRLPGALRAVGASFSSIPTVTATERERIQRSLEPTVATIRILGLTLIAVTLVIATIMLLRSARAAEVDSTVWAQLGLTRRQQVVALAVPGAAAVLAGALASIGVGWLGSARGPVGSAGVLSPATRLGVPGSIIGLTLTTVVVGLGVAVLWTSWLGSAPSRATASHEPRSRLASAAITSGSTSMAMGVRAAWRRRGGHAALLAAMSLGVALVVAALLFSVNLVRVVDAPARFGWPYDVGVLINYGYDGADVDAIAASLDRPEVLRWGVAATYAQATIGGKTMPMVADLGGLADLGISVVEGSLPRTDSEVALGSRSADAAGLSVGDSAVVSTEFGDRDATVSGIVVMPPVGAFLSDRAALGTGMLTSGSFFTTLLQQGEVAAGMAPGTLSDHSGGFVGIDLRDGVDVAA